MQIIVRFWLDSFLFFFNFKRKYFSTISMAFESNRLDSGLVFAVLYKTNSI